MVAYLYVLKDRQWLIECYKKLLQRFYFALYKELVVIMPIENLHGFKKILYNQLYYSLLLFRVWNHLFLCSRSQYESNMCLFCTKLYLKNEKIWKFIKQKWVIDVLEYFPVELSYGVISDGRVNTFVHWSVRGRQKFYGPNKFSTLFYEVLSSLFILWEFYLDVLTRLVLNSSDKLIIPTLRSGIELMNIDILPPVLLSIVLEWKKLRLLRL